MFDEAEARREASAALAPLFDGLAARGWPMPWPGDDPGSWRVLASAFAIESDDPVRIAESVRGTWIRGALQTPAPSATATPPAPMVDPSARDESSGGADDLEAVLPLLSASNDPLLPKDQPEPDGPVPPDGWRWNGREVRGLQPLPWRLIAHLWGCPERCGELATLAEPVWQDRNALIDGTPFGSARKRANAWLAKSGIPLRVESKAGQAVLREGI